MWGWKGAALFPVSCSAVLLWIHQGFPNTALEMVPDLVTETKVTPQEWNPGACVSPSGRLGLLPRAEAGLYMWDKSWRENCAAHMLSLQFIIPPTASQQARAGGSSAAPLCYATKTNSIACCANLSYFISHHYIILPNWQKKVLLPDSNCS